MRRERKMMTVVSLFVAVVIVLNVGILGYNNGHQQNDNLDWDCAGSCHTVPSAAIVTMSASNLNPAPGEVIDVTVNVSFAEASNSPLGVMITRSMTTTPGQDLPSLDGWVIINDPSASGSFNYYEGPSVTGFVEWTWQFQAPLAGGTYHLYAREHHGNPLGPQTRFFSEDTVGLTFTVVVADSPPTFYLTNPGSTLGEQYVQGSMISIDWVASDDNPWPSGGLVVNLTYGPTSTGGTPITNLENVGAGTFAWDTTGVAPGVYYINGSVYDSIGQIAESNCNNSFEIIADSPPLFYITNPGSTPGEQYAQGTVVPISWAALDDNPWPATGLIVNITYGPTPTGGTPIANNQDVVTIFAWDTTGVPAGTYYINASVWDSRGQTTFSNCNNSFEIIIVDLPPKLFITNPGSTPAETYGQGSLITVSWAAYDESPWPSAGNVVNISYGPTQAGGTPLVNDQDVTTSYSWDTTAVPLGFYYINASVYDSGGNVTFASSNNSFEITAPDSTPPVILNALATPSPQELGMPTNISASITDDTMVNPATVFVNVTYPSAATTNISMSRNVDLYWVDQPFMEIGMYNFIIWAADTSANWASDGGMFEVVDTTPPVLVGTSALPSPQFSGGAVNISAEITDLDAVATADVEVFDPLGLPLFNVSMLYDAASGRYYWTTTYVPLGTYTFDIWTSDPSVNWATDSGSFVIASMAPPSISGELAQPSPQEIGGAVNISAVITDDNTVSGAWVEVVRPDMTVIGNFTMTLDSVSGRYYYESTYTDLGTHTFTIWAQDNDGLFNSTTGSFEMVDTTPPTIVHAPITSGNLGVAIPISANVTDLGTVAEVRLYYREVGAAVYQNTPMILGVGNEYSASIPPQGTTGNVRYYIEATDASSNIAWHPDSGYHTLVIIDSLPPTISNTSADPANVETGNSTTISALIEDDSGITEVQIFITGPDDSGWSYQALFNSVTGKYETVFYPPIVGQYGFTIWAMDGSNNWGTEQGQFNATLAPGKIPNPPVDVETRSVEGTHILISWVAPNQYEDGSSLDRADIQGYYVYRSESPDQNFISITNQPVHGELYLDGGVSVGRTYYYRIVTVMMDSTASSMSDYAEGELEEEAGAAGADDILPWLVAVIFLVLWILTLVLYMMRRKKEGEPIEKTQVETSPPFAQEEMAYEPETEPTVEEPSIAEIDEDELIGQSEG